MRPWEHMVRAKRRVAGMKELPGTVREYFEMEAKQDEAIYTGRSKDVRKYARQLYKLDEKISESEESLKAFVPLLDDDNSEIRLIAACFLGEIGYESAVDYLRKLDREGDFRAQVKLEDLQKRGKV